MFVSAAELLWRLFFSFFLGPIVLKFFVSFKSFLRFQENKQTEQKKHKAGIPEVWTIAGHL